MCGLVQLWCYNIQRNEAFVRQDHQDLTSTSRHRTREWILGNKRQREHSNTMLFLIDLLNDSLTDFSKQTGFARQDLVMIVCLLLCYPASFFFLWLRRRTPSPFVRHCYSILPAIAASVWLFGWDTLHSFVSSTIGYFLVFFFKGTQYSYKVMFVYAMTYLSASHLFRWAY